MKQSNCELKLKLETRYSGILNAKRVRKKMYFGNIYKKKKHTQKDDEVKHSF